MTDDIEQRLDAWGRDEQPAIDGAFANRLDSHLRDVTRDPARQHRPLWQPALLAAAALIIVAGGLFAFIRTGDDDVVVVMGASTQTEIEFPDGSIVDGSEGLALPDGTRIIVGSDGSAVVADVVLEPGTEAIINKGQLEILGGQTPTTSSPRTTVPTSTAPTTTAPSTTAPPTTTPSTTAGPSSTRGDTTSTTSPRSTTTAPPGPSTTAERPVTSTTVPEPLVELEWMERNGNVVLIWSYVGPESLAGWHVTVTNGDRTRTLAVLRDPAARSLTVEQLDAAVTYQVTAREADGTAIAESNPVAVP